MNMKNLKFIHSKTKELLKYVGRTKVHTGFVLFPNEKIGIQERKKLRQKLIEQIKKHKDFTPILSENFSSYRREKTEKLQPDGYKNHKKNFDGNNLLKLEQKPNCPYASISLSHCNHLGAFLFVFDKTLSIGLDIEWAQRVTNRLVDRISSKEEVQQTPQPSLLWTAKEASLKCFSNEKTSLFLKDCLISNWKKEVSQDIYFFDAYSKKTNEKSKGAARIINGLTLAYAEMQSMKF